MRHSKAALAVLLLVALAGCVTVDGTMNADGSGTVEMAYRTPENATEASVRRQYTSDHVKVDSVKSEPGAMTTLKVSVDDVTKLSTASAFNNVTITRAREDGTEKVTIRLVNQKPVDIKNDTKPGPTFNLTFPGKVVEANRDAKVNGDRATWTFKLRDYAKESSIDLVARYELPAAGK